MRNKVKQLAKNQLISGSAIVVIGNLVANFFNFLYNLFMGRMLTPAEYGIVTAIVALITFPALLANAISPTIMRFAGSYFATGQMAHVRGFYIKIAKIIFILAIAIFIVFFILIPQISGFFHITDRSLLIVTDLIIFLCFVGAINIAFLQAKLAFAFQVVVNMVNSISKLFMGVVMVMLGYSTFGAVSAVLIGSIAGYVLSFVPLKFLFEKKTVSPVINSGEIFRYGLPSTLTLLGLTSFISIDIILVKHFFEPTMAGVYAGISLIARVIFYISAPIGTVMFPLIVQKHSRGENFTNTFKLSLFLVLLPASLMTITYFVFPEFAIKFFFPKTSEYLLGSSALGIFGLFISSYCFLSILSMFYLSIKKTKVYLPVLLSAFLQVLLIWFFHESFIQVITISLITSLLALVALLLYYPHATKRV